MKIISRIESIRAREHEATVALIAALLECDRDRAHITLGYSSMWDFLTRHLHYSNAAASRRYKAMKCAEKFPRVLDMLRNHETNLSALATAEATLMRAKNADELLGKIANKSQVQVEQELARHNPQPKKRETVRRFAAKPDPKSSPTPDMFTLCAPTSAAEVEDRVQLGFSVSAETYEKFERAKALLSSKHPKGLTLEEAFEELVDTFLKSKARAPKPRKSKPKSTNKTTRHIPAATRRAVLKRDKGRCTYVGPTGTRCNSTHDIELDHILPWVAGGSHDADNLRVLCATHNRHRNLTMKEPAPRYSTSAPEVRTSETTTRTTATPIRTSESMAPAPAPSIRTSETRLKSTPVQSTRSHRTETCAATPPTTSAPEPTAVLPTPPLPLPPRVRYPRLARPMPHPRGRPTR